MMGCAFLAAAVDTRYWSQDTQSDFEKGARKGVALRSDGRLSLAPSLKEIADPSLPYLWSIAVAANGTAYTAGGPTSSKSTIFEIPRGGAMRKYAEIDGGNVFALAVARDGRVYAGSSPDGKVYRLSNGSAEVFYDPKAKYIWAMSFLSNGDLLVATGDKGELHRVSPNGTGKVWMKLDEDHIRSLAIDSRGQIFVGTEPGGLIVRVDANGNGFVVYQSSKREVTSLLASNDGTIFASIIGNKSAGSQLLIPQLPILPGAPGQVPINPGAPTAAGSPQRIPVSSAAPVVPNPVAGGSEVVQIAADGAPMKIWNHASDLVYAMARDNGGRVILGTGNKGSVYRLESPSQWTLLLDLSSTQVTAFAREGNRLLAVTGNVGKMYEVGPSLEREGSLESEVFDVSNFAQWGRLHSKAEPAGGSVVFETRSGNLDRPTQMWSAWTPLNEGRIVSPSARFLQWRAILKAAASGDGPSLTQVDVAYLPKNLAPRVDLVEGTPANYRFPPSSTPVAPIATSLNLPPMGKAAVTVNPAAADSSTSPALTYARGMIGARWMASDDNGDALEYAIEIKGENEQTWKPLKDKLRDRYHSYDATTFGDGRYQVRVTASDQPDNPIGQGLTASAISSYFLIDNTAPRITDLSASPSGGKVTLRFKAADALSVVTKAEISINGGEWRLIEPTVRLADSKDLEFVSLLDRPAPGEMTIAVRVTDEFDNQSVEKTLAR